MRRLGFILIALVALFFGFSGDALAAKKKSKGNPNYASIVMDAETGAILRESNADKRLHPASLTKMMTLMLTFEALDAGKIGLHDRVPISKRAAAAVPSKLGLAAGSSIKVEDAIYALVTKSANDIALAMAEFLGGTEPRFARVMTERAQDIGMSSTVFRNASGLHDPAQITTARDMARLGRYILARYPHHYHYFSTKQFTYRGHTYRNHNRLMSSYPGMDGFKTGYINASGFNLVASAKRDGRRLIGVVFGGRTTQSRNDHMKQILDESFGSKAGMRVAALDPAPLPGRKPSVASYLTAPSLQDDNALRLAAVQPPPAKPPVPPADNIEEEQTADSVNSSLHSGLIGELIGEGDYDPAVSKRLETGLLAVAVHTGAYKPNPNPATPVEQGMREVGYAVISKMGAGGSAPYPDGASAQTASLPGGAPEAHAADSWSVQIGAYNSRVATDHALRKALARLPQEFSGAKPVAVPLRTAEGVLFRARLAGLSKADAARACGYFKDCLTIAPRAK